MSSLRPVAVAAILSIAGAVSLHALESDGKTQGTQTTKPTAKAAPKLGWTPAIEAAFKKAYPNATVKAVSKEKEDGKVQYEVESMDGTQARDVIYLADGTLVLMKN